MYILPAEIQKTLVKFNGLEILLFTKRAYTKRQDIHDQESFSKSGFRTPESNPNCGVTASDIEISSLLNRNSLKHSKKSKIFFPFLSFLSFFRGSDVLIRFCCVPTKMGRNSVSNFCGLDKSTIPPVCLQLSTTLYRPSWAAVHNNFFSCPRSRFLYISSTGGHAQRQRQ